MDDFGMLQRITVIRSGKHYVQYLAKYQAQFINYHYCYTIWNPNLKTQKICDSFHSPSKQKLLYSLTG